MTERSILILGGTGDLARRLLLPGIGEYAEHFSAAPRVVGADMAGEADYPAIITQSLRDAGVDGEHASKLASQSSYVQVDATSAEDLARLLAGEQHSILYFALPPAITSQALQALAHVDLPDGLILAIEKPIGHDATSAREVNSLLAGLVPEDRIFRVDHFLGMSATVNIGTLRSDNRLIDPLWNNEHLAELRIVFNETLGVEGRAAFYDRTGAARDMIQSHLLQVMARTLADEETGHDEILAATTVKQVRRGRYTAGTVGSRSLPSYINEDGVDPESTTETWARMIMSVDTDRWRGVPIVLESGKAIGNPRQEITAIYKTTKGTAPNTLRLAFESDDLLLELNVADAAEASRARVSLASNLVPSKLGAYGRVIAAILNDQPHMKLSAAATEQGWRILDPVLTEYQEVPMEEYPAGTTPGTKPLI